MCDACIRFCILSSETTQFLCRPMEGGGGLILEGGEDMEKEKASVDLDLIPAYVRPYLLSAVADAVTEYFGQPGVQGRYERWLEAKKAADKSGK